MPSVSSISVNDGETTPVTHVFVLAGFNPSNSREAEYVNLPADGNPGNAERLRIAVKDTPASPDQYGQPGVKVAPRTVSVRLHDPKVFTDSTTGINRVDYPVEVFIDFKVHPRATVQEVKNLRTLAAAVLMVSGLNDVFDKGLSLT